VQQQYTGATYPDGTVLAGMPFNPKNGGIERYSPDVMIPAFLATYAGGNANTSSLNLFPSMLSMLPNWRITYSGLSKLDMFKKYFKSVNINHSYKSVYSVGSFNTYSTYQEYMNGLGFIQDVTTGNPVPSSMFDISAVSINEQFAPLIGVDVTLLNNITAKAEYRKSRVMNLSMSAIQLVETTSNDIVLGVGYKLTNLKLFGTGKSNTGKGKVSNDLNLRADFSWRDQNALCRNIQDITTQATSGNKALKISFSADYTFSRMLTLNAYYDHQTNIPVISASSYPTSTNDFGISLKFSLTR
jgi:cell surface protein SprA